ncbi:hypothetical protein LXL04_020565 [Taraxacum kok-saghyz]
MRDPRRPTGEWHLVQRRRRPADDHSANGKATTFYFQNFPPSWDEKALWTLFKRYRTIVDVYIPKKLNAAKKRFGFARFLRVLDIPSFEKLLNSILIGNSKMDVNLAKYDKRAQAKKEPHRPYGCRTPPPPPPSSAPLSNSSNTLRSYVDAAKGPPYYHSLMNVKNFKEVESCQQINMRYLGGLRMLLEFEHVEAANLFLDGENERWKPWFSSISKWHHDITHNDRIASLVIQGVPPHAWCEETFSLIAGSWGTVIIPESCCEDNPNMAFGRVAIITNHPGIISSSFPIAIDNIKYSVNVLEDLEESAKLSPVLAINNFYSTSPFWTGSHQWNVDSEKADDEALSSSPDESNSEDLPSPTYPWPPPTPHTPNHSHACSDDGVHSVSPTSCASKDATPNDCIPRSTPCTPLIEVGHPTLAANTLSKTFPAKSHSRPTTKQPTSIDCQPNPSLDLNQIPQANSSRIPSSLSVPDSNFPQDEHKNPAQAYYHGSTGRSDPSPSGSPPSPHSAPRGNVASRNSSSEVIETIKIGEAVGFRLAGNESQLRSIIRQRGVLVVNP